METPTNSQESTENTEPLPVRQNLVDTAAQFLAMDNIVSQPSGVKRQFLEKKGLTKQEIEVAFQESKNKAHNTSPHHLTQAASYPISQHNQMVPTFLPPLVTPYAAPSSFWIKLRDASNTVIFLSGIAFGFRHLYKHYICPFLTGGERSPSKEELVLETQKCVMEVLRQIEATLQRINAGIVDQGVKMLERETESRFEETSMQQLRTEVATIKSLLINTKSFPAAPSPAPSIPQWQKRALAQHHTSTDNGQKESTANGQQESTTYNGQQESSTANGQQESDITNGQKESDTTNGQDTDVTNGEDLMCDEDAVV